MSNSRKLIELQLRELECNKQSEKDGDEIYCLFKAISANTGTEIASERVPINMDFWHMQVGGKMTPNHTLYIGEIERGLICTVSIMEMDVVKLVKDGLSLVGKFVDDFVGRVEVRITPQQGVQWVALKNTALAAQPATDTAIFRMTGNRSDYRVTLTARIADSV